MSATLASCATYLPHYPLRNLVLKQRHNWAGSEYSVVRTCTGVSSSSSAFFNIAHLVSMYSYKLQRPNTPTIFTTIKRFSHTSRCMERSYAVRHSIKYEAVPLLNNS